MKKRCFVIALSLIFITALALSSCSKKSEDTDATNTDTSDVTIDVPEDNTTKKQYDTPSPIQTITGKYAFGDFSLTIIDRTNGSATLEYTDAVPESQTDLTSSENIALKRVYSVELKLLIGSGEMEIDENGNKFSRMKLYATDYELFMRTEISGDGAKAYINTEKARLKTELDNGIISENIYKKYVSILDGENILYESGESINVSIITYYDKDYVFLTEICTDINGDGKADKGNKVDYLDDTIKHEKFDSLSSSKFSYTNNGTKLLETFSIKSGSGYVKTYEKQWKESGVLIRHSEYYSNGRMRRNCLYDDAGNLNDQTDYLENGKKQLSQSFYPSGNLKSVTDYYESGYIKTLSEYNDKENATPNKSYYIDGQNFPALKGTQVDAYEFVERFKGFWVSDNGTIVISLVDEMPYVYLKYGENNEKCLLIDKIALEDGEYTLGLKNYPDASLSDTVKMCFSRNELHVIEENNLAASFTLDPGRTHLGEYPTGLTELTFKDLEKFVGSWTEIYHHGYHISILKTEDGYIYRKGIWETDAVFTAKIEKIYYGGNNKYVLALSTETYYNYMNDRINQASIGEAFFYDIPDGTYEMISAKSYPPEEHAAFMKHPLIQPDKIGQEGNPWPDEIPSIITPDEMAKVLKGRWVNGDNTVVIGNISGKPCLEENGTVYSIDNVTYNDKYQVFILTLSDPSGESYTRYFKIDMTYTALTFYKDPTNDPTYYFIDPYDS